MRVLRDGSNLSFLPLFEKPKYFEVSSSAISYLLVFFIYWILDIDLRVVCKYKSFLLMVFLSDQCILLTAATENCINKARVFAVKVEFKEGRFCFILNLNCDPSKIYPQQKHDLLHLLTSNIFGPSTSTSTYKVFALTLEVASSF